MDLLCFDSTGQAQAIKAKAEADAQAIKVKAEAEAQAIKAKAEAEAYTIKAKAAATSEGIALMAKKLEEVGGQEVRSFIPFVFNSVLILSDTFMEWN